MPSAAPTATGSVTAQRALGYSDVQDNLNANKGLASMVNSDISTLSPGALANKGIAPQMDDRAVNKVAATLAGELGPKTLAGVAARDPKALAEAAAVTSVAMNRIGDEGLDKALRASQFNAWSGENLATTKDNFSRYGAALADTVKGVASGAIQSPAPDATHYANRDVSYAANKSYNKDMVGVAKIGDHTFGTINGEFNGKTAAAKEQETRARQAVSNFSDYSGISRQEQSADRKATSTVGAPSTGLGSKSKAAEATKSATDSAKASDSTSSSTGKSDSSKDKGGSDKSSPSKSGSGVGASGKSSGSAGAGAKGGASVGGSASKSSSSSSSGAKASGSAKSSSGAGAKGGASVGGKGVGSSKSSDSGSKSKSSGAKGAEGARS
jgi:post-segregation antitoxin (ccd killing protein)